MTAPPPYYLDLPAAERAALNNFCCGQTDDPIPVYSGYVTLPAREDATDADEHWAHEGVSASAPGTTAHFVWVETAQRDPDRVYFMPADSADLLTFLGQRFKISVALTITPAGWIASHIGPCDSPREALCHWWTTLLKERTT